MPLLPDADTAAMLADIQRIEAPPLDVETYQADDANKNLQALSLQARSIAGLIDFVLHP